ncbi:MAG: membrane-bound lytic murein transglycosylase MltF [Proteobacteria bacterium]|nr:membrane-bound lytic murein transglycosylase MltF [Pseudomonadota bacterium]
MSDILTHTACQLLLLCLFFSLSGCSDKLSQLDRIQSRGSLRVALIATPPLYFPDESLIKGYDYEVIAAYADAIGVELEIIRAETISEIIALLKQGKAHIGITGSLPVYPDDNILYGEAYNNDKWYVIGHRDNKLPKSIEEITPSTVIVANGSTPSLILSSLKPDHPGLFWLELPDGNNRQVLEQVNLGNFRLSVISEDIYTYYRYLYPEIKIAFTLPKQYPSHWLTYNSDDISIYNSMNNFIRQYKVDVKFKQRYNAYFSHLNVFNYIDIQYYLKRIASTLPEFRTYFEKAAVDNDFDMRFLAAISYQESHWNAKARSHTGVRGLMMLTKDTAKRVGVTNRLDPEQSIIGGTKYLGILKNSLPEQIQEPDRSWMTLAAYNVGLGHLEDARIITQSQGDDPNRWVDVEKHLPKLSKKEWHKKTKHGYARGHEPVAFVRRVRRYYDILRLYQQEEILEKMDKPLKLDNLKIISPVF